MSANDQDLEATLSEQRQVIQDLKEKLELEVKKREGLELNLKESRNNLADTQGIARIGHWNWDVQENRINWSDELFRLLEYEPANMQASRQAFLDRVHPEDLPEVENAIRQLLTNLSPFSIDHRIILPGGIIRFVNSKGRPEMDENEQLIMIYGILQDITKWKQIEQELRIKEKAIDSSFNGIGIADITGRLIYVNDSLVRMWGYRTPDEILGKPLAEFWSGSKVLETVETIQEHGSHFGEDTGLRKDGSTFPVQFTASMIKDDDGHPVAMFGSFVDISLMKKAEQDLTQREKFQHAVLSSLKDHLCVIDKKGEILMVNQAWLNFARDNDVHSLDKISPGINYLDSCKEAAREGDPYAEKAIRGIRSVLDVSRWVFSMEYPCSSKTEERWFSMTVVPLHTEEGGAVIAHANITERKNAQLEILNREKQLSEAQRIAHLGSYEWNIQEKTFIWSDELFRILGFAPREIEVNYEKMLGMIHPDDQDLVESTLDEAFRNQQREYKVRFRIVRKDKSVCVLDNQGRIVFDDDGNPLKLLGVGLDVTDIVNAESETKRLQAEMAHLNRVGTIDVLASALAHEINQPLAAIMSNAQAGIRFLNREEPEIDEIKAILENIVRDDRRVGNVVKSIRSFVKKDEMLLEPYHPNHVIEGVFKLLYSEFVIKGVALIPKLDNQIQPLMGNAVQMQQVLINILMNAIEALSQTQVENPAVMLTSSARGHEGIFIHIDDNGPGLGEEEKQKVFNSFYTTKSQGLGLGLAICKSIINDLQGTLSVTDSPIGGARFTIWLPRKIEKE